MTATTTNTIALIHGAFVSRHSWDNWLTHYRNQGYNAVAIPWPLRDEPVSALKAAQPDPRLGALTLKHVIAGVAEKLQSLDEKPVIVGHSLGGLLTQLMLQRHLGLAGVAIDSVPPLGVLPLQWSFFKAGWPVLNPFKPLSEPYYMSFPEFQYAFANGLPVAEQQAAYDSYTVPESRRVALGGLTPLAQVNFKQDRPPLLLIAGEKDNFIPAGLNRSNFKAYAKSPAVTDFKEFPGRNHFLIGAPGWEEIADYALSWFQQRGLLRAA